MWAPFVPVGRGDNKTGKRGKPACTSNRTRLKPCDNKALERKRHQRQQPSVKTPEMPSNPFLAN